MKEIKIDIDEDEARYFGHALVTFHCALQPVGTGLNVIIARKSSDTPYLGSDGWQASPAPLDVEVVSQAGDKTVVRAGPSICDRIPYSLYVRMHVEGTDVFGQAFWPEIMQSPKGYTAVLGDFQPEPQISKLISQPETQPLAEPPPVFEPPPVAKTEPLRDTFAGEAPRKSGFAWIYLLLLLVVAGAGLGYWQWDKISAEVVEPEVNPVEPTEALSAKFERLKVLDTDGDELLALSEEAFKGGDRDIGQQSIDLAVQRGNEQAKIEQAKWYDPSTFAADRVDAMDANRAARAYFELALGGNADATKLLTSICNASKSGGTNYRDFFDTTYCQGSLNP
ncbi:hypothetical protein [Rhizobium giardinii]|uniref:hypothetical protein n=1 Tax=Rhizobium giardinii TaxID=56731 RepID=UPI003D6E2142